MLHNVMAASIFEVGVDIVISHSTSLAPQDDEEPMTRYTKHKSHPLIVIDPAEMAEFPSGRAERALWFEERMVKSPWRMDSAPLRDWKTKFPADCRRFRRFESVPVVMTQNDALLDVKGEEVRSGDNNPGYSMKYGLF
ncbi:hypothetical protein [Sutterella sp.]|uniref:hypothetical protein n=1 Tax=Sutterella sp. TaxID=1981025 RepID=UPI0026E02DD5|nr:hypothetical protein [Sutterella sp.]MDO5532665.1 hypothetical protein [Sutterella sp.]